MAISAAFGMGIVGASQGTSRRQPQHPTPRIQLGRVGRLMDNQGTNTSSMGSNSSGADVCENADTPMEVSLNEKVEFLPPGYAKDTVFQFKNPLVSDILQSDAMAKQCDFTLVSEAKGVIKGAAPTGRSESAPRRRRRSSSSSTSPAIGGLRRLMKRAHTPEGLVTHYEDRLRAFLDLDSTSDGAQQSTAASADHSSSAGDGEWQMIEEDEGMFTPMDRDLLFEEDDVVVLNQALAKAQQSPHSRPSHAIAAGISHNLVTEWVIPDSFTRLIVHTMCRYYGLVSFSETSDNGQSILHICHPRFFKDAEATSVPDVTFHQFLYSH